MPESDVLQILLYHDHWATSQMLDACANLSDEQFHRRFDIGPGSLHDTLTHIAGAMRAWTDTLAGQPLRPRVETDGQRRTPEELRALLEASRQEFLAETTRRPLSDIATRTLRGTPFHFTRAAIFTHIATHGMHHRAQCLNMLKQLGVHPLPASSVAEWTWMGQGPIQPAESR